MGKDNERTPLLKSDGCCGGNKSGGCCKGSGSTGNLDPNTAVPLKRGDKKSGNGETVWPIERVNSQSSIRSHRSDERRRRVHDLLQHEEPLQSKCAASGGQCCKDLKGDDERHLISPEVVRDVIIGLSDGLTVPFALTAGLSSLGSDIVVTGGLAELCAGAISMGLGGFLASQAELDHFHYLRKQTHARVLRSCDGEMEREVHAILGPLGVKEGLSRLVAEDLLEIENDACPAIEGVETRNDIEHAAAKSEKRDPNVGLTAFLLKFGEGMEEVPKSRLWISAITIGMSYFIGGLIPLIPYMLTDDALVGLFWSCVITGIVLFIFGGAKTYFTGATGGVGGYLYGSVSTMLVGGVAAASAFVLVRFLEGGGD